MSRWNVSWPWSVIFRRLSHLGDSLQSYLIHCSTRCQNPPHSTGLRDVQTLQQQGAQRVEQTVPCPRVMHSYISLFPGGHSYWLSLLNISAIAEGPGNFTRFTCVCVPYSGCLSRFPTVYVCVLFRLVMVF